MIRIPGIVFNKCFSCIKSYPTSKLDFLEIIKRMFYHNDVNIMNLKRTFLMFLKEFNSELK